MAFPAIAYGGCMALGVACHHKGNMQLQIRNSWKSRYAVMLSRTAENAGHKNHIAYLTKGNVATKKHQRIYFNGDLNMKIDINPEIYTEEYNRKTTDFGNGMLEIVAYHHPKVKYIGGNQHTFPKKKPELSDKSQEERTRKQLYAIRRRIRGYALANDFKWFVTLTFNPEKINSLDYNIAKTALLRWCRLIRNRYGKFDYLLVPELHKSGAVHFHGLIGNISADFAEAVSPKTRKPLIRHGRQVYNLTDWEYGFSDCEKIESPERAASYITKYVTTALLTDKEMYNKKRYFNSQGLIKPKITFDMRDNTELSNFTPNFGIIGTDIEGKNVIDVGIYKLATDSETGALIQKDTDYLIMAKEGG